MKLIPILFVAAALTIGFGAGATWALDASGVTDSLLGPEAAAASQHTDRVDGHPVAWWATRARANGAEVRTLRRALRLRVSLAGGTNTAAGLTRSLLCLHAHEGPWGFDPRNPNHYGGLQMDSTFENDYGSVFVRAWGHAYNWPPYVQLAVAARAVLEGRGFDPWQQTRSLCGL